ncbi:MAG TPA: M20 family metallopeptidase [Candidatus Limnocylindria bacterium]|jgi:amidohydrolase|nr:M20 family metallopeptidase [Candidatus Limnocylindria bacterium]
MPPLSNSQNGDLIALSRDIHAHPELAYQERYAASAIGAFLERRGYRVERGIGGIETAFRARVGPPGPSIALLAEYDALPDVGHGCGHNLIAISNVGAFLVAAGSADRLEIGVELIGTPAEENGGGKIDLLRAGVFGESVAALSSHPESRAEWRVGATGLGVVGKRVTYTGVAAHAGSAPEKGRNALNAVIRLFVGVDGWREHLEPDSRVHGVITDGGKAMNVVPARAEAVFGLRAPGRETLDGMVERFAGIAEGAALLTGTKVEIAEYLSYYEPVRANVALGDILAEELTRRGTTPARGGLVTASTDLGNVSQQVPTDWIRFPVSEKPVAGHSDAMREASVSDLAHQSALIAAEALGATAVRVAGDRALRERIAK